MGLFLFCLHFLASLSAGLFGLFWHVFGMFWHVLTATDKCPQMYKSLYWPKDERECDASRSCITLSHLSLRKPAICAASERVAGHCSNGRPPTGMRRASFARGVWPYDHPQIAQIPDAIIHWLSEPCFVHAN